MVDLGMPVQCKDIPDAPILEFLATQTVPSGWHDLGDAVRMPSVRKAFPPETPDKLVLAKMRSLIRRGLVEGCACGCRGDFRIVRKEIA